MQKGIDLIHEVSTCEMSNNGTEYRLCSGRIESCSMEYLIRNKSYSSCKDHTLVIMSTYLT